ncbi:conserved hypothetical protein [Talaromyces stipitatus ATCC 10500]|uniref:Uncharacterized protein n=1 Tax=Talaromyces stipitatus (strain ATCC 10500 / CBS 375.48 / QM 6759 / NRRL 1006) TaxID=441959 RepID=B8MD53_TALSN|nr:uncharacterized protein TSTA_113930 [Talaromyces stipitatus ATCC 10500]EED17578.1 conserved hypothetical protein [Talaromyces stipitatus ATCC 10500]
MVLLTSSTVATFLIPVITCQHGVRNIERDFRSLDSMQADYEHMTYDTNKEQSILDPETGELSTLNQGNFAYLQLLSEPNPASICSTIAIYKKMFEGGSTIQDRLFMYPQEWDLITPTDPVVSQALSSLREASVQYKFWLLPIDMHLVIQQGYSLTDSKLLRLGEIQFMAYDSVLYLRTPGLLLDAQELDKMILTRPLPMKYEPTRQESYRNAAWIGMPLRAHNEAKIPPVYLISVNSMRNRVEARTHVPNVALRGFGDLAAGPNFVKVTGKDPAYVFFDWDEDGRIQQENNTYYDRWRQESANVCGGLDLSLY